MSDLKIDMFAGQSEDRGRIDAQLMLPGEKNDIEKIYHIDSKLNVRENRIDKDVIQISGDIEFHIYYLDKSGTLDSFTATAPFDHSIEAKGIQECNRISVRHRIDELSGTVSDARTIQLTATVYIVADVISGNSLPELSMDCLQKKSVDIVATTGVNTLSHSFNCNDEIRIPGGMDNVDRIIGTECYGVINGIKKEGQKAICYGDLCLSTIYSSTSGLWQLHDCIPFEEEIDCESIIADKLVRPHITVNKATATAYEPEIVSYSVSACISLEVAENMPLELVTDAYSLSHSIETIPGHISIKCDHPMDAIKYTMRVSTPADNIERPLTIMATPFVHSEYAVDGAIALEGELVCDILYQDEIGQLQNKRISVPLEETIPASSVKENMQIWSLPKVQRITAIVTGDEMEFRCMLDIDIYCDTLNEYDIIKSIAEKEPLNKDNSSIMIYFRDDNEDIFDIGKKYHVALNDINAESDSKLILINPCT